MNTAHIQNTHVGFCFLSGQQHAHANCAQNNSFIAACTDESAFAARSPGTCSSAYGCALSHSHTTLVFHVYRECARVQCREEPAVKHARVCIVRMQSNIRWFTFSNGGSSTAAHSGSINSSSSSTGSMQTPERFASAMSRRRVPPSSCAYQVKMLTTGRLANVRSDALARSNVVGRLCVRRANGRRTFGHCMDGTNGLLSVCVCAPQPEILCKNAARAQWQHKYAATST